MTFRLVDTQSNVQNAVQGRVPADDELLYEDGPTGQPAVPYLVQRRVMVSGDRLRNASSGFDPRTGQPVVNFAFDTRGATDFGTSPATVAAFHRARQQSDLRARHPADNRRQGRSGLTLQTASDLAILLNAALCPQLTVIEERTVGGARATRFRPESSPPSAVLPPSSCSWSRPTACSASSLRLHSP
jgi:preprotein translocase subunit SecD